MTKHGTAKRILKLSLFVLAGSAVILGFAVTWSGGTAFYWTQLGDWYTGKKDRICYRIKYAPIRYRFRASRAGLWLHGLGEAGPDLEKMLRKGRLQDFDVTYSWTRGFGNGDVWFRLRGDGRCWLTLWDRRHHRVIRRSAEVGQERVREMVRTIEGSGLLRQYTEPSPVWVYDRGNFNMTVSDGLHSKTLTIGTYKTIEDTKCFWKVRGEILSYSKELGVKYDWQAFAATAVPAFD